MAFTLRSVDRICRGQKEISIILVGQISVDQKHPALKRAEPGKVRHHVVHGNLGIVMAQLENKSGIVCFPQSPAKAGEQIEIILAEVVRIKNGGIDDPFELKRNWIRGISVFRGSRCRLL